MTLGWRGRRPSTRPPPLRSVWALSVWALSVCAALLQPLGSGCARSAPAPDPAPSELPSIALRGSSAGEGLTLELAPLPLQARRGEELGARVAVGRDLVAALAEKGGRVLVMERAGATFGPAEELPLGQVSLAAQGADLAAAERAVVVGAPGEDDARGAALVFEKGQSGQKGWGVVARLEAPDRLAGERCGRGVALGRGVVALACDRRVVVFERAKDGGFTRAGVLPSRDDALEPGDSLGGIVAIDGDTVVTRLGGPKRPASLLVLARSAKGGWAEARHDTSVERAGDGLAAAGGLVALQSRAPRQGASTLALLRLGTAAPAASIEGGKLLGDRLAMDGGWLVAGERTARTVGRVHVYSTTGGSLTLRAVLAPNDGKALDWFGAAVAVLGPTVAIGSPARAGRAGGVYVTTLAP